MGKTKRILISVDWKGVKIPSLYLLFNISPPASVTYSGCIWWSKFCILSSPHTATSPLRQGRSNIWDLWRGRSWGGERDSTAESPGPTLSILTRTLTWHDWQTPALSLSLSLSLSTSSTPHCSVSVIKWSVLWEQCSLSNCLDIVCVLLGCGQLWDEILILLTVIFDARRNVTSFKTSNFLEIKFLFLFSHFLILIIQNISYKRLNKNLANYFYIFSFSFRQTFYQGHVKRTTEEPAVYWREPGLGWKSKMCLTDIEW